MSAFYEAVKVRWANQTRDPAVTATETLFSGQVVQGSDTLMVYTDRFLSVSRLVPPMPPMQVCQLYIAGLDPSLKPNCKFTVNCRLNHNFKLLAK
jgi:hypothetical protein